MHPERKRCQRQVARDGRLAWLLPAEYRETRTLTGHSITMVLYFLAILSGAGLAYAYLLVVAPVLARLGSAGRVLAARGSGRLKAALSSRPAIAVMLLVPFAGVVAALWLRGGIPADVRPRNALLAAAEREAPHDLPTAVKELAARLVKDPNDAAGWRLLARSYAMLGETDKAASAARRAAALDAKTANDPAARSATAEDLVTANDGKVVPEAQKLFEAALRADPTDPRARFYLGLAAAQQGNREEALKRWLALEADSPPDAPWLAGLKQNIGRLATAMGLSASELAVRRAAYAKASPTAMPAPPGPTASDIAAAAQMSPADRANMIKSMVARLADEMKRDPNDVAGWMRLGHAYAVLGEKQKSLDAYRHASEADPGNADAKQAYANAEAAMRTAK